jgi:hypothetical protein
MGPMNPRMSMIPQHQNMMHQMHPGQQPGQPPGPGGPGGPGGPNPPGQSSPARASPMSHASPMGVNHHSPHMQPGHMPSPNMQHMMNQGQPQQHPAKNDDYNLDFLDSIPTDNDNSGAPGSQGPGGPGSENSGPGGGPPGGGGGGGNGGQNHHRTQAPNAGQQQPPPAQHSLQGQGSLSKAPAEAPLAVMTIS